MQTEHLDRALAEEFAGHGEAIHRLKISDPAFKSMMERNHAIWLEIHRIEGGEAAASDTYLESLKKQRLAVLDEIAAAIRKAEA
jgi:uncharacterized protein YdcH (DUF465 family)